MKYPAAIAFLCCLITVQAAIIPGYKQGIPNSYWYYKFHSTGKSWNEASLICQSEHGQLAVITSDEEAKIFVDEFARYPASSIVGNFEKDLAHLGFYNRLDNGKFVTIEGKPLPWVKWQPNQPDNWKNDEHCGSITRTGLLNDVSCSKRILPFFCKSLHPYLEPKVDEPEPKCLDWGNGYKLGAKVGDRFYKLHLEPKNWNEALLACQSEGATLAVINSEEEAQIYSKEINQYTETAIPGSFYKKSIILGYHDRFIDRNFMTIKGIPLKDAGYSKWAPGEPNNSGGHEHCGTMLWNGLLNDAPCDVPLMFICEKPFIKQSTDTVKCSNNLSDEEATKDLVCEKSENGYVKGFCDGVVTKYYKLYTKGRNWDEALLVCQADAGSLAVLTSDDESKLLSALFNRVPASSIAEDTNKNYAIVGFHDRIKEGQYMTVKGKLLSNSGFYKWAPGQPDNDNKNEHCGSISRSGLLNDVPCDVLGVFFCEKKFFKGKH